MHEVLSECVEARENFEQSVLSFHCGLWGPNTDSQDCTMKHGRLRHLAGPALYLF